MEENETERAWQLQRRNLQRLQEICPVPPVEQNWSGAPKHPFETLVTVDNVFDTIDRLLDEYLTAAVERKWESKHTISLLSPLDEQVQEAHVVLCDDRCRHERWRNDMLRHTSPLGEFSVIHLHLRSAADARAGVWALLCAEGSARGIRPSCTGESLLFMNIVDKIRALRMCIDSVTLFLERKIGELLVDETVLDGTYGVGFSQSCFDQLFFSDKSFCFILRFLHAVLHHRVLPTYRAAHRTFDVDLSLEPCPVYGDTTLFIRCCLGRPHPVQLCFVQNPALPGN
jgi:hypothetical protein